MSEGPEVRRVAQMLHKALAGETIRSVEPHHQALRAVLETAPDALIGRRIIRIYTLGKHILFELDNGAHLHNHLLMFGSWRIYDLDTAVPPDPRVMEIIRTDTHRAVLRGGSVMELLPAGGVETHRSLKNLGPDLLGATFDEEQARANLKRHPDMEIGVALVQQEIMAGLGNYLKSEALFIARMNPHTRIGELTDVELRRIIRVSREVILYSFTHNGYTIPEEIQTRLDEHGMSPATVGKKHFVFRRTNKPCWKCGTPIRQFRQGEGRGRITYVCPRCQHMDKPAPNAAPRRTGKPAQARARR